MSVQTAERAEHDEFEQWFWGTCTNTLGEELKQIQYARLMGLELHSEHGGQWRKFYDVAGKSILDIGGGPSSMLLKVINWSGRLTVVDPGVYPDWVRQRYECASIDYYVEPAETFETDYIYDEAWIYNVLTHTDDPKAIVDMTKASARVIRLFEWIETRAELGHPAELHADEMDDWLGSEGSVARIGEVFEVEHMARDETPRRRKSYRGEPGSIGYYGVFETP